MSNTLMTAKQSASWLAKQRGKSPARYANVKKVQIDGHTFDSKREAQRYCDLLLLQKGKVISELWVHPRINIVIGGVEVKSPSERYPAGRQVVYEADFSYLENGVKVYEDVKMASGFRTEVYKLKRAMMLAMGIRIRETT